MRHNPSSRRSWLPPAQRTEEAHGFSTLPSCHLFLHPIALMHLLSGVDRCCTFPSESRALFWISGGQQSVKFGSVQPILRPTPEFATSPDRPPTSRSRALHGAGAGCVRAHTPSPRNEYSAFAVLSLLILPSSEMGKTPPMALRL